jgi:hypothetical protein
LQGIFWKAMPNRSLIISGKCSHGVKEGKDRFTAMIVVSMIGEKIPPMIIGRSEQPRTFPKHCNKPFYYSSSKNAWLTNFIFLKYLNILNNKFVAEKRMIALILDNCSSHSIGDSVFSNIKLFFLPPNTTAVGQPLDCGIIELSKRQYRTTLVKNKLDFIYKHLNTGITFSIDFYTAVNLYTKSFLSISPISIINCWRKRGFFSQSNIINFKFNEIFHTKIIENNSEGNKINFNQSESIIQRKLEKYGLKKGETIGDGVSYF